MQKLSTILVLNGPNLNFLGNREKNIYGSKSLEEINEKLTILAHQYDSDINFFQSNYEGVLIDKIQDARNKYSGIIINAGAYTHTSIALLDALRIFSKPVIEVHMSNIYSREWFRRNSFISYIAEGSVCGFGFLSYEIALKTIIKMV
tara:strand:- start:192 stop:632 length:441 start_codon:yes stop_codon:yes gene_type:complete